MRIALNLKKVDYESVSYHLRKKEHQGEAFLALNPQGLVPALELPNGEIIRQSVAIIEYLDTMIYEGPQLIPSDPLEASRVRAIALDIACDVHPINNLRILQYLRGPLELSEERVVDWVQNWIDPTFSALDKELANASQTGKFCHRNEVSLADICLIPQIFNAERFGVNMHGYPKLSEIYKNCMALEAFEAALPGNQPDAE